jgi:large subunit ribosomal protein L17
VRHRVGHRMLKRPTSHRLSLLRNLVTDLIRHEKVKTTDAKARELRREVEHVITLARRGDLHARRLAMTKVHDPRVITKLFDELAPRLGEKQGGYTRMVKLLPRRGDSAPMAQVELIL